MKAEAEPACPAEKVDRGRSRSRTNPRTDGTKVSWIWGPRMARKPKLRAPADGYCEPVWTGSNVAREFQSRIQVQARS